MAKNTKKKNNISNSNNKSSNSSNISSTEITSNKKVRKSKKVPIKKGQWSLQEDNLLKEWVKQNGTKNWEACGRFIQGRRGKQCREHWNNCLNPDLVKGEWTEEEDFLIMFFYEKCKGSWKKIVSLFNGRIENSIKNRFYSKLRKHATKNMNPKERRRVCPKIKLHELKNYLNLALNEAKADFLKKSKMNEEQFNLFLKINEQKIKETIPEESENLDSNLSTNYMNSFTDEEINKKILDKEKKNIQDNSCENNGKNNYISFLPLENYELLSDKNNSNSNFDGLIEFGENYSNKNVLSNLNTCSNDTSSVNSYHKEYYDINDNAILASDDYNISDISSINYDEFSNNNSLMSIFKENECNFRDNKPNLEENLDFIFKRNIF